MLDVTNKIDGRLAWTDERVELLRLLFEAGMSGSQIASELGDVTRGAVLGKLKRLGLAREQTPSPVVEPISVSAPAHISIMELTDRNCHWPIGDPLKPGFSFCGCAVIRKGSPYCVEHRMDAYDGIPQPKRRFDTSELSRGRGGVVGRVW